MLDSFLAGIQSTLSGNFPIFCKVNTHTQIFRIDTEKNFSSIKK
jgi:hypothetical protein